jgi:ferric-dicitrate binding protein FerR (iron transport regulator)
MNREPSSRIESLLKLAGERDQPSADAGERAREAARASWQRGIDADATGGSRTLRRGIFSGSLAAGLVAVAATLWLWSPRQPPVDVARVAAFEGQLRLESGRAVAIATPLRGGEVLATGDGRVALAVGDALSLRLDRDTRLRFDGVGQVTLLGGALYVDSGGLNAQTVLRIHTPAGAVRHVGTQFQVRVRGPRTLVRVREGRVVLLQDGRTPLDLGAGDSADVAGADVRIERKQPGHGPEWEWAAATAPAFDIENRPLSEFLAWLAREHGWHLRYADAATQSRAQDIRLHGSMPTRDAAGMLDRASLITGIPLVVNDGMLLAGGP